MKHGKSVWVGTVVLMLLMILLAACQTAPNAPPATTPPATPTPSPEASEPAESPLAPTVSQDFSSLVNLIGMTREELLSAIPEDPVDVDEGGLGFEETGIRVWFDTQTYTKVAQVLIMSDAIDINGAKIGDSYSAFQDAFGTPVSDENGDARFPYGGLYLSVVRDTSTDTVVGFYILAENL